MSIARFQLDAVKFQLQHIAGISRLQLADCFAHVDNDTINLILEQAARFADTTLAPLAASGDIEGCTLVSGRVHLPAGTPEAWREWCELGFPLLGIPLEHDGMGFPRVVQSAVQELLDGANLAFGMLGINLRCAALALIGSGTAEQCAAWLPGLASGEIASTIVISEPQAGSDVGRILTAATPDDAGHWVLNGTKIWISYGDHDATNQILHLVLARVPNGETGTRGLGLFIVPRLLDEASPTINGITIRRLEHKMGLHGSPTCVFELENSRGWLVGEAGKGLQALFVMMNAMRQAVTVQGSAVANVATLHAIKYAQERPQGGHPLKPAIMITNHADVRRMLLEMTAHSELARALSLRTASYLDQAECSQGEARQQFQRMAELLLPVAKTCCSELAFQVASQGIQVLGGYGYTSDYPLERLARDIRVTTVYEGTSGIQAMDFLKRKVLGDGQQTLNCLLDQILETCAIGSSAFSGQVPAMAELLRATLRDLAGRDHSESGSYATLQLTALVVHGWHAHCLLTGINSSSEYERRLDAALQLYAAGYQNYCHYWAERALSTLPDYGFTSL